MTFDAEKMAEKLCTEKALGDIHLPKDCPITKALQQAYDLGAKEGMKQEHDYWLKENEDRINAAVERENEDIAQIAEYHSGPSIQLAEKIRSRITRRRNRKRRINNGQTTADREDERRFRNRL